MKSDKMNKLNEINLHTLHKIRLVMKLHYTRLLTICLLSLKNLKQKWVRFCFGKTGITIL